MRNARYRLLVIFILLGLMGCSGLPFSLGDGLLSGAHTAEVTRTSVITQISPISSSTSPIHTEQPTKTTTPGGDQSLRIWLPPGFDPNQSDPASQLLKARFDEFEAENPGVKLEVRVKAVDGPGGVLDSLIAASAAAPSDLPDLVLLPRSILESAALKGLLYPYDTLTSIMDDQGWFEYARQMAHVKSSIYGIPFAGDIMVLAYSPSKVQTAPTTLEDVLTQGIALLYPAADPQALFTLCMYLAEGGKLQDEQGRPALEETSLVSILNFDQQASLAGLTPYTLTQLSDDDQVWEALLGGQSPMAVTWASTVLKDSRAEQANLAILPLPTPGGVPFSLATGWSWALAGQDAARRSLGVKLVESLVVKEFLTQWTQAASYLPPRVDALQSWQPPMKPGVLEQISASALLQPSSDILSTIGPALQTAVMDVLSARKDPQAAAKDAIIHINQP